MKTLFGVLLLACSLSGGDGPFLLPDEAADAIHRAAAAIDSTKKNLLLTTADLRSRPLVSAIEKALERGVGVTIVTGPGAPGESSRLAQYAGVTVMIHRALATDGFEGSLQLSALLADDSRLCIGTVAFDDQAMRHHTGLFECSEEAARVASLRRLLQTVTERSDAYLK